MYDGPEQVTKFKKMIKDADVPSEFVILRDRWHTGEEFAEYITNRAGTVTSGMQTDIKKLAEAKCFYPAYHAQIDWNGDCYLCPHDWQRRNPVGNLMQEDFCMYLVYYFLKNTIQSGHTNIMYWEKLMTLQK